MAEGAVANGTYVLTLDEYVQLNNFCLWTGFSSPAHWNTITGQVVLDFANYLLDNFNDTLFESTLTIRDISKWAGGDVKLADEFVNGLLGGSANATDTMFSVANLLPFIPHPQTSPAVVPLFFVCTILTLTILMLRLYSRQKLTGQINTFDWIAVLGFIVTVAFGGVSVAHAHANGPRESFCDRTWAQIRMTSMLYYIELAIYPVAIFVIKSSLLLFYYSLSQWKGIRYAVMATFALTFGNAVATFFAWIFQCNHINSWDVKYELVCPVNMMALTVSTGAINIITDLLIWAIPMPLVWKLQLYPRERILAIFTFGLGLIACVASGFRLVAVKEHVQYSATSTSTVLISVWSIVELNLALICASAPAIRALFVAYAPKILSSYGSSRSGGSGYSSHNEERRFAAPSPEQHMKIYTPPHNSFDEKRDEVNFTEVTVVSRI